MKRLILAAALTVLISLLNILCQKPVDSPPVDSSTITVLYPWDERVLGPFYDVDAKFLVFLPLFMTDENGHIQGKLAERWEHSDDFRSWTFYLCQDVKWHDGVPVTAHDIKFTLELISHPDILYDDTWLGLQSITVHDDYSLTLTFESPKDFLEDWLVYWPKHILEKLNPKEFWEWDFWTHPIGNGPYRYVRHVPKTMIEFEANPDYFLGEPKVERIILKFGGSTPLIELKSGNVDVIAFFKRTDIQKLEGDHRFHTYYSLHPAIPWLLAIYWNLKDPLFQDPNVRRALTMAINRKEMIRILNMPEDIKIFDVILTGHQYRHNEFPPPIPYDPEDAVRLLERSGWKDNNNDGVLEKQGRKFSFKAIVPPSGEAEGSFMEAAVYIQSQFREIGIQMEVQGLDTTLVRNRIKTGRFQASFNRYYNSVNGHLRWLGGNSPLGYNNPQVSSLLHRAKKIVDPAEIDRIYSEIIPIIAQDLPLTILFPQVHTYVVHRRIKGLSSPWRANPVENLEHLWIEEEE